MVPFSVLKVNYFNTNRINHGKVKAHLIPEKKKQQFAPFLFFI